MEKQVLYSHDGETYQVVIRYKRMKYIRFYFRDNVFYVSSPYLVNLDTIKKGLDKYFDKLVKKDVKSLGITDEYIYLFGNKILFENNKKEVVSSCFLEFQNYVIESTKKYEQKMNTVHHQIKIKSLKSKYGSNDLRKNIIEYASILMHYRKEIIDSVIIHELAHCFEKGHQENFYKVVYKYCPNYKELHKCLRKGEF